MWKSKSSSTGWVINLKKQVVLYYMLKVMETFMIVLTAVQFATKCATTIIGEDADILVLLCYYSELAFSPIYF